MKFRILPIAVTVVILGAAGCANNGPNGGHTEKWYEAHPTAQTSEIIWCGKQSLATNQDSKSCRAANDASKAERRDAREITEAFTSARRLVVGARAAAEAGQTTQTHILNKTRIGGCASIAVTPSAIGPTTSSVATITVNSNACSPHIQGEVGKMIAQESFGGGWTSGKHFHISSGHGDATISVNQSGAVIP
jgi:hypothetical protein